MKIAIVGGGASGLFAAIVLSKNGLSVDLYEKNGEIGKKIKASGNGHCNIFNTNIQESDYAGDRCSEFLKIVFSKFDFRKFERLCNNIGLFLQIKENGRVYPLSNESRSVTELFLVNLKNKYVEITGNSFIKRIESRKNQFYLFNSEDNILGRYDIVVLATGSKAYYQIDEECNSLAIASSLGHTINTPYPSLVPIECVRVSECRKMSGIKIYACVEVFINNKKRDAICGDVLFTKYGLSGFAILDISQIVSFALLNKRNAAIFVNFLPSVEKSYFKKSLLKTKKLNGRLTIYEALLGYLPKKVAKTLLHSLNIENNMSISLLSQKMLNDITYKIFHWRFDVLNTHGFEFAEVSGGGVSVKEIDSKTMESKLVKNLYLTGEILDIVGKRGGYNLAFAFATGYIAALDILKKTKKDISFY